MGTSIGNILLIYIMLKYLRLFDKYLETILLLILLDFLMNQMQMERDIKENKVKEGFLMKQSRHIKEWRERWVVLTKTRIYTFANKTFKDPTEMITLNQIQNIKSFYKGQYQKPHVFRIQTNDVCLYFSVNKNQEKWSWMTAIQKTLNRIINPNQSVDYSSAIRQTLKMSGTMRQTFLKDQSPNKIDNVIAQLKFSIIRQLINVKIQPTLNQIQMISKDKVVLSKKQEQQSFIFVGNDAKPKQQQKIVYEQKTVQKVVEKVVEKVVQKVVEKIVYVPKIQEKIVYVPQIQQKIVYVPQSQQNTVLQINEEKSQKIKTIDEKGPQGLVIQKLLSDIISHNCGSQNIKYMVDFICSILCSQLVEYQKTIVLFCLTPANQRFFCEVFLIMLNEENDTLKLNMYWKFLITMYDSTNQYLYSSDIKVLIDIVLREIQMSRSQLNQFLIITLLLKLANKKWWKGLKHRNNDLKEVVQQLASISAPQNSFIAHQLIPYL